jgi:hypothetical protein
MRSSVRAAGLLLAALGSGLHAQGTTPTGWVRFRPDSSYFVSLDTTVAKGGRASLTVRAIPGAAASADGYNGARQFVDAAPYRGKRVRVRAHLRGNNAGQADLYMRVEGFAGDTAVRWFYDDMANRPFTGTFDWKEAQSVLDVPPEALRVTFGALLVGGGQMWADEFVIDIVDASFESTTMEMPFFFPEKEWASVRARWASEPLSKAPANLGFEERQVAQQSPR